MSVLTSEQVRTAIFEVLSAIAPETDPSSIKPDAPLRDQVDLDSFDFLNVIIALNERLGVEVPESDYQELLTLDGMVEYLMRRSATPASSTAGTT
jgi:acyl carrier protein